VTKEKTAKKAKSRSKDISDIPVKQRSKTVSKSKDASTTPPNIKKKNQTPITPVTQVLLDANAKLIKSLGLYKGVSVVASGLILFILLCLSWQRSCWRCRKSCEKSPRSSRICEEHAKRTSIQHVDPDWPTQIQTCSFHSAIDWLQCGAKSKWTPT